MPTKLLSLLAGLVLLGATAGCSSTQLQRDNDVAFWVVAGTNRGECFSRNSLAGYDSAGMLLFQSNLPDYHIDSIFVDSMKRLWLGQAWNDSGVSSKLLVWANGRLLEEVTVGQRPEAGMVEFNDQIVVGCAEMGFGFSLWSVDLNKLESRKFTAVNSGGLGFLLLTAVAASEEYLIVAGAHDNPNESADHSSHTSIWWYDRDFFLMGSLSLEETSVWSIVALGNGSFLLLNNSGFLGEEPDLLLFDPETGEITGGIRGAGYPYRGFSGEDGKIYILNRIWSSVHVDSRRSLTIIDDQESKTILLPDGLGAVDIAAAWGDNIYLAVWQRGAHKEDGIYLLNTVTGDLEQVISYPDASRIIVNNISEH